MASGDIWTNVKNSQVISTSRVVINCIMLTPTGGNADCTIYDGESASDPEISCLQTLQYLTFLWNLDPPLETQRGLYIALGSNVDNVLVSYRILQD